MKVGVAAVLAFGSLVVGARAADTGALKLWYRQPAAKWTEALPIGNGHMGAMVFGGTANERVQFNEDTLWKGKPHDYVRAGAGDQLAEIRRLVFEGKADAAGKLAKEKAISDPVRQLPYQPFGDLRLAFPGHENATDYRRELDLDKAIATTSYRVGNVGFKREAFASFPARVMVVHLTASQPGQLSFSVRLDSPHTNSQTRIMHGRSGNPQPEEAAQGILSPPRESRLILTGQVQPEGLSFESQAIVFRQGGEAASDADALTIANADEALILIVARTSFVSFQDITGVPAKACGEDLGNLVKQYRSQLAGLSPLVASSLTPPRTPSAHGVRDFAGALRDAHVADHQSLFRRVKMDLGQTPVADLPTDERLNRIKKEGLASDPALAALHFQYGRYLLIASSRPGSQPANLQGVWNEDLNPPWESKYTLNINAEMNYWPAEIGNLSECHEPLFSMIDDLTVSGARAAREQYGCGGWVVHHNTDLWRGAAPINNVDGFWPTGGAWLSHHLWEHYLFSGDKEFLKKRAYPVMKSASEFFVDFLVKDPNTGYLVTCPSHSPEQTPPNRPLFTPGPTMDNQLIRQLFSYTIQASEILGKDKKFARQIAELRAKLPPNQVGSRGQLQEWLEDWDAPNNNHRHMSPLWGLYPGWDITPADPKVYDAAKVLLKWRGNGSTGWSFAWRIPLWARVGDSDFAFAQYEGLLQRRTLPNLFDLCGPFQIDGNFGACGGVMEMLLQSHLTEGEGKKEMRMLDLLPALPKAWPKGSVSGLKARGGFEVDLAWEDGALTKVTVRSQLGEPCKLRCQGREQVLKTMKGMQYPLNGKLGFGG